MPMMRPPVSSRERTYGVDLVEFADLLEHLHDLGVRATVQLPGEGPDGGRDRGVDVGPGAGDRAGGEGGSVQGVVGVQDQGDVQLAANLGSGVAS